MIASSSKSRQQIRHSKKIEIKNIQALEKTESAVALEIKKLLNRVFLEDGLKKIAVETKFLKRERKLTSFAITAILLMGSLNGTENVATLEVMCCFLRKWFGIEMKPQSLQEQINTKQCADFIKAITIKIMVHEANKIIAKLFKKTKKSSVFSRILLQDSTVISLPETVSKMFRGCGGSASRAAVKWDIIFDQSNHLIVRCKCISGRIPDASLSEDILNCAQENDLIIRDMGYFNLSHFNQMDKKKQNS